MPPRELPPIPDGVEHQRRREPAGDLVEEEDRDEEAEGRALEGVREVAEDRLARRRARPAGLAGAEEGEQDAHEDQAGELPGHHAVSLAPGREGDGPGRLLAQAAGQCAVEGGILYRAQHQKRGRGPHQEAELLHRLAPAHDGVALVVLLHHLARQRRVRHVDHGLRRPEEHVPGEQPQEELQLAPALLGGEHRDEAQCEGRRAHHEPGPSAAPARLGAVRDEAHDGVAHPVEKLADHEGDAGQRRAERNMVRVVLEQVHGHDEVDAADSEARHRVQQHPRGREPDSVERGHVEAPAWPTPASLRYSPPGGHSKTRASAAARPGIFTAVRSAACELRRGFLAASRKRHL